MSVRFFSAALVVFSLCRASIQSTSERQAGASPVPANTRTSFRISEVANVNHQGPDAPSAFYKAHAKYSTELDPRIKAAIRVNSAWSHGGGNRSMLVEALPSPGIDTEYVLPIALGTPPQTFYIDLDTGSADFWVMSSDTKPRQVKGHTIYRPENSSTARKLKGQTWNIHYGDGGGAHGVVYTDRMQIGEVAFVDQGVESALAITENIASDTFTSGLLGLAASWDSTVTPDKQRSFMENVKDQLKMPLFTANLKRQEPGTYSFGEIEHSEYIGDVEYTSVDPEMPYWHFSMSGYQIEGHSFVDRPWSAIADTGTTLLLAPDDILDPYYRSIKGAAFDEASAMYVLPCDASPPDFYFGVGSHYKGHIPGKYLIYSNANESYCYGGAQSSSGIPFSVAGDVLLKSQFVVFDYGEGDNSTTRTIGFANKNLNIT